jgi:DNA-binding NarL/FixJ family response regulator
MLSANLTLLALETAAKTSIVQSFIAAHKGYIYDIAESIYKAAFLRRADALAALAAFDNSPINGRVQLYFEVGETNEAAVPPEWLPAQREIESALLSHVLQHNARLSWQERLATNRPNFEPDFQTLLHGRYPVAEKWLEKQVSATSEAPLKQGLVLTLWALVKRRLGQNEAAHRLALEAVEILRRSQNKWGLQIAYTALASSLDHKTFAAERQQWLDAAQNRATELENLKHQVALPAAVAKAARLRNEGSVAADLYRACLPIARLSGSPLLELALLLSIADANFAGREHIEGAALVSEVWSNFRQLTAPPHLAGLLVCIGYFLPAETAPGVLIESFTLAQAFGKSTFSGYALLGQAHLALSQKETGRAAAFYREAMALSWRNLNYFNLAVALEGLARCAALSDKPERATHLLQKAFSISKASANTSQQSFCLLTLADFCLTHGHMRRAALAFGASEALRHKSGLTLPSSRQPEYERLQQTLQTQLGERRYAELLEKAAAAPPHQIFARTLPRKFAATELSLIENINPEVAIETTLAHPALSKRELEILNLLVMGLTDAQIAVHLSLSNHTVSSYLRALYTKLAVNSRTAAATYAIQHRLVILP